MTKLKPYLLDISSENVLFCILLVFVMKSHTQTEQYMININRGHRHSNEQKTKLDCYYRWDSTIKLPSPRRIWTQSRHSGGKHWCTYRIAAFQKVVFSSVSAETDLEHFQKVPPWDSLSTSCVFSGSMLCCRVTGHLKHNIFIGKRCPVNGDLVLS